MTTVVFDGVTLAADSQRSRGAGSSTGERHCLHCKEPVNATASFVEKLQVPKKPVNFEGERVVAVATAGTVNLTQGILHAIFTEMDLNVAIDLLKATTTEGQSLPTGTVLVLTKESFFEVKMGIKHKFTVKKITKFPYFAGSGADVARCGMEMLGLDAAKAVQLARQYDKATGGEVRYIARKGKVKTIPVDAKVETNFSRGE
jgi:hypothetical protein